ncbi:MAG: ORF6N domain-containing protein [Candidatus Margulisiibacteriota bacterium]|jgi:hypothetical protein
MDNLIPIDVIENKIVVIRGEKVMLDRDLAVLYNVENGQLKRQVRRNINRFPDDFMFILNEKEVDDVVCHFGIPLKALFGGAKPFAFTEHGILMLSSVLNSDRAIQVNIQIMRTFSKLRRMALHNTELHKKINEMEKTYDAQFKIVFDALRQLIEPPVKPKRRIGFLREDDV